MFEKEAYKEAEKLKEYQTEPNNEYEKGFNNGEVRGYKDGYRDGAEFGYNKSKAETALLSQHILDLQKDKGNLTDRVRELEQQIEKMKCCYNCSKDCGSIDRRICFENKMKDWVMRS